MKAIPGFGSKFEASSKCALDVVKIILARSIIYDYSETPTMNAGSGKGLEDPIGVLKSLMLRRVQNWLPDIVILWQRRQ
jgi:hypothetical protein